MLLAISCWSGQQLCHSEAPKRSRCSWLCLSITFILLQLYKITVHLVWEMETLSCICPLLLPRMVFNSNYADNLFLFHESRSSSLMLLVNAGGPSLEQWNILSSFHLFQPTFLRARCVWGCSWLPGNICLFDLSCV